MWKLAIPATRVAFLALTALKLKNNQNMQRLISNGQENTTKLQKNPKSSYSVFILTFMTFFGLALVFLSSMMLNKARCVQIVIIMQNMHP